MRFVLLAVCALAGASFAFDTPAGASFAFDTPAVATVPPPTKAVAVLDKIAVIGASLSAGYGMDENPNPMSDSKLRLANVIDASLLVAHQPIEDKATAMFFISPEGTAKSTLKKMREWKPTTIVALDYLFWFGYGEKEVASKDPKQRASEIEAMRVADLDAALKDLGAVECTIVLADLPDMTPASLVPDPMISPAMVPAPATLKTLNEHVAAFAKEHANVVLVPLAAMTARLQADEEIQVRGNTWPKGSSKVLMPAAQLHPTVDGACAVWIMAVDTWLNAKKDLPASAFELDAAKVVSKVKAMKETGAGQKSGGKSGKKSAGVEVGGH
jgi:hypothetical protein